MLGEAESSGAGGVSGRVLGPQSGDWREEEGRIREPEYAPLRARNFWFLPNILKFTVFLFSTTGTGYKGLFTNNVSQKW